MILLALAVIRFPPKRIARTVRLLLETITMVEDDSIYSINGNILIYPATTQCLGRNRPEPSDREEQCFREARPHSAICRFLSAFNERDDTLTAHLLGTLDSRSSKKAEMACQDSRYLVRVRVANAKPLRNPTDHILCVEILVRCNPAGRLATTEATG